MLHTNPIPFRTFRYLVSLGGCAIILLSVGVLSAQDKPDVSTTLIKVLRSDELRDPHAGVPAKSSLIEITMGPGVSSPPHRHPGPVIGYVLEGTYQFAIEDEPVKTLRAGDSFFEAAMVLHRVSSNPASDTTTRILVTMVHPADATKLVLPAELNAEETDAP